MSALLAAALLLAPAASAADPYSAKTYPRGTARKLVVETDSGAIVLKPAGEGPTSVDLSPAAPGDDCRVSQDLRNGVLKLAARAPELPRNPLAPKRPCAAGFVVAGAFDEADARSGSGDIDFGMETRKARLKSGAGSVRLAGTAAALTAKSGSGTVSGRAPGPMVDVETGSGDISLTGLTGQVRARSGSGAISLDWDKAPAAGLIEVQTGSGNLEALFPRDARLKPSLRSATGILRTDLDDKDAKLRLNFRSGSGGAALKRKP